MKPLRRAVIAVACAAVVVGSTAASAAPGRASGSQRAERGKRERPKAQPSEETCKEGMIAVVRGVRGGEPQLTERSGTRWLLVGPLQEEVLRLGGHTVKVWAAVGEKKLVLPTLDVRRYEILDAGASRKPFVGTLRQNERSELQLHHEDGTSLNVQGKKVLLDQLRRRLGCKVWLAGELDGGTLKTYKFGWLSCAKQRPLKPQKETSK